eukprot:196910-Hanusia_phi.AAC.1
MLQQRLLEQKEKGTDDDKLVYLDGSYFQGAVGAGPRKELLLFRRKAFSKQWRFLPEEVIKEGVLGNENDDPSRLVAGREGVGGDIPEGW